MKFWRPLGRQLEISRRGHGDRDENGHHDPRVEDVVGYAQWGEAEDRRVLDGSHVVSYTSARAARSPRMITTGGRIDRPATSPSGWAAPVRSSTATTPKSTA